MINTDLQLPLTLNELRRILRKHGVVKASVFGSYARGEALSGSDLDIVVDYRDSVSLFDHFDLKDELAEASGTKVDVLSSRAVSRHLRPYIDKDKVVVL